MIFEVAPTISGVELILHQYFYIGACGGLQELLSRKCFEMSRGLGASGYRSYGAIEGDDEPPVGFRGGRDSASGPRSSVSPEFHQLCEDITSNVFVITNGITTLDRARKSLGTVRDTQGLRDQM